MKRLRIFYFSFIFLLGTFVTFAQIPESFVSHRVKKGETIEMVLSQYQINLEQLQEYNPVIERFGIRRRMNLRIPVYSKPLNSTISNIPNKVVTSVTSFTIHEVVPKETKWRLAYQYNTTIALLDSLNPEIKAGLKIGQKLKIPITENLQSIPEKDSLFNYYKVLPKEGFYRIEKKLGVDQATLDSLNPILRETGLQVGMILKIPGAQSGELRIENDLLVERVNLIDSTFLKQEIKLAVLLPFKANEIILDSVEDTKRLLQSRNLHTISLDFYTGLLFAVETANQNGLKVEVKTYDTENSIKTIDQIASSLKEDVADFIIGPLIPSNFNYLSGQKSLSETPKISPLSSNPVVMRKNVY
ncbi:LysM peptidoglycan-binding domain-containing protein, partial [Flavobacteriaceae bacterium]|nr:LysM peptidoglycan-binding domain-containing protein [Flavobacteriaceae bacterium]